MTEDWWAQMRCPDRTHLSAYDRRLLLAIGILPWSCPSCQTRRDDA